MSPVITTPKVILQLGAKNTRDGLVFHKIGIGTVDTTVGPRLGKGSDG